MTSSRRIFTFYSYKGGSGRTMALANTALLFAKAAKNSVLAIDWDLEAPGLHYFFDESRRRVPSRGLLHYILDLEQEVERYKEALKESDYARILKSVPIANYCEEVSGEGQSLKLLTSGCGDSEYGRKLHEVRWEAIHFKAPFLFASLAESLRDSYEAIFVDSRTGVSDMGGICTAILPDVLVAVFVPNRQSVEGTIAQARKALEYRRKSPDLRPLMLYPLPTRIAADEPELRKAWRFGDLTKEIVGYQDAFETFLEKEYQLDGVKLERYFDDIQIQHVPQYAYGECLAGLESGPDDRFSLRRSYELLCNALRDSPAPWSYAGLTPNSRSTPPKLEPSVPDLFRLLPQVEVRAAEIARTGDKGTLRRVVRINRHDYLSRWRDWIQTSAKQLSMQARSRLRNENDIYSYGVNLMSSLRDDARSVERFGLPLVEKGSADGVREMLRFPVDWIGLSLDRESGVTLRAVLGAPALLALECLATWGAVASYYGEYEIIENLLTVPAPSIEDAGVSTAPLVGQTVLWWSEAMLGTAPATVRFLCDTDQRPYLAEYFQARGEYRNHLQRFFLIWAMASHLRTNQDRPAPFYFVRRIDPSGCGLRGFTSGGERPYGWGLFWKRLSGLGSDEFKRGWETGIQALNSIGSESIELMSSNWTPLPTTPPEY